MEIIEGTRALVCTRCSCTRRRKPAGSNQRISTLEDGSTACRAVTDTIRPYTWASGSGSSPRVRPGIRPAAAPAAPAASSPSWLSATPFERPVVPPV